MWVPYLWHKVLVVFVLIAIMTIGINTLYKSDAKWQKVNAEILKSKITATFEQIHWQWQNEGRPARIFFKPKHALKGFNIDMTDAGFPKLALTEEACTRLLEWVINEKALNNSLKVTTTINKHSSQGTGGKCNFEYEGLSITYQVTTGKLTFV